MKIIRFETLCLVIVSSLLINCSTEDISNSPQEGTVQISPDINDDGKLNVLILGTSVSIKNSSGSSAGVGIAFDEQHAFASNNIAMELNNILSEDPSINLDIHVEFKDIYKTKEVNYGLGAQGTIRSASFYSHSLMQYYHWPDGQEERLANLANEGTTKWDYIIIGADPYIIGKLPGYYALGVNTIISKIAEGGAKASLLMVWPQDESATASIDHYEEYTYRTADGAKFEVTTIPAGLAWEALPSDKKDEDMDHPSPNGAYTTAATIYAQLFNKSAAISDYEYDDTLADIAFSTKSIADNSAHYTGERTFISPFKGCEISDNTLNYNHTGTSTENGILNGLQWVIAQSNRTLITDATTPINFNYGRANTNFEANKRYHIDPAKFDFSMGFPMQDHANTGNTSMLYGLDKRKNEAENGTDLGTALYMVRNSELPFARAIPMRTLYAQIKDAIPSQSAFRDNVHIHRNLDKAVGAYMYTLLTGECNLAEEPTDNTSEEWKTWRCHKIGLETAYTLMTLKGNAPSCD